MKENKYKLTLHLHTKNKETVHNYNALNCNVKRTFPKFHGGISKISSLRLGMNHCINTNTPDVLSPYLTELKGFSLNLLKTGSRPNTKNGPFYIFKNHKLASSPSHHLNATTESGSTPSV